jgi:hypothetical protein
MRVPRALESVSGIEADPWAISAGRGDVSRRAADNCVVAVDVSAVTTAAAQKQPAR